jgi:preprotein translocase subunit SecD
MRRGTLSLLLFIILLAAGAGYVVWPSNPGLNIPFLGISNPLKVNLGLDLQGGLRVLLKPSGYDKHISMSDLQSNVAAAETHIAQRVSGGLGVTEANIRLQTVDGLPGILVELPGFNSGNQSEAVNSLLKSGVLEFWSTGTTPASVGTQFSPSQFAQFNPGGKPQFTGNDLDSSKLGVGADETGRPQINFAMNGGASANFCTFTQKNVGQYMTITLDKVVIQSAVINSAICGQGAITGNFTQQQAQDIVTQLKYGALPISFTPVSEETVGATLGADSIRKSAIAAIIGLGVVMLFMLLYYRLPGLLADLALLIYAGLTFAVFKLIGVTLSLAGIAGFILSIGMAVDANVLIFERVKEELRAGRLLSSAIDIGWKRAWNSIRDSNISTMLTCCVLYFFGSNFGATLIVGFATTLFLGVAISMFTAVVVTRTFLNILVPTGILNHPVLFALPSGSIASGKRLSRQNSKVAEEKAVRGESRV